ncbi:hypothetical protein GTP38_09235 [Duganella sp. FT94W]|uniref:TIM barrel protein n=1 Tax=Duganella lactea TaxID=2692173 RepID=A0ABW9V4M3_9BURK|nr:TIM barrel protein [Duganella lactea]MYM34520.1 hypothetical protein [Duganella lactea]
MSITAAAFPRWPGRRRSGAARGSLSDQQGKRNAIGFLQRVRAQAEARGVTLVMENINSGHSGGPPAPPGSMFDHLPWGLDVVTQVNSSRVKLLPDLYHAQLMDGNITNFLRNNIQWSRAGL